MSFKGFEFYTYKIPFLRRICSTPVSHVAISYANVASLDDEALAKHQSHEGFLDGCVLPLIVNVKQNGIQHFFGSSIFHVFTSLSYQSMFQVVFFRHLVSET